MRVLYVSQTGMLEGLGQAQVLPYLRGLAKRGAEIELLSYELSDAEPGAIDDLRASLAKDGVHWLATRRRRDNRFVVKVAEAAKGVAVGLMRALARRPDLIHGRSYFPTAVGDAIATVVPGAHLLFDCRGMIGDEYVDAGYWTRERLEYRAVKRFEARAFRRADGVVVLTDALQRWIRERGWFGPDTQVETIPCCVDLAKFTPRAEARAAMREELGVTEKIVVTYSGSLGSWYREADIARFAGIVRRKASSNVAFLLLTPSPPAELASLLEREGFGANDVIVRRVPPVRMPEFLAAADIGISFIKSCFSKTGSSPTKVAEYLACGLPVVLNGDIGDQADLAAEPDACVVVDAFSGEALADAAARVLRLAEAPFAVRVERGRELADRRFGLERVGVERYARLYSAILSGTPKSGAAKSA